MLLGSRGSRIRCLVVWAAATAGLGLVALVARLPLARADLSLAGLGRTPLDVALTEIAALALLGCSAWLWVATTSVVLEALRGHPSPRRAGRCVPAGLRRVVLAACGVVLAGGLTQPSYAVGQRLHHEAAHAVRSPLSGLPLPDRAVAARSHDRRYAATGVPRRTVRVRPGDSLWSVAARDLPGGSADAVIAARWRAIYAANRSLIGPDPDVIVPGQRLHLPGKDPS